MSDLNLMYDIIHDVFYEYFTDTVDGLADTDIIYGMCQRLLYLK